MLQNRKTHPLRTLLGIAVICVAMLSIVAQAEDATTETLKTSGAATVKPLPKLVDLGANKCIPCKMMAPILEGLKTEYTGKLEVEFIDVWENPELGEQYGVAIIPTQIFYDASGKERFRHQGFFSKEDILAKWKELGVSLDNDATTTSGATQ
jgi:thioredoxin 1